MSFTYLNGIKIGQLEVVKWYGFVSVRSNYKEYLTSNFKVASLHSTLFDFKPLHSFAKICTSDLKT